MSHQRTDLLCIGEMMLRSIGEQQVAAGASLNVAAGAARCYGWPQPVKQRLRAAMLSGVVDDSIGRQIISEAQAAGVDTSLVAAIPSDGAGRITNVTYSLTPAYGNHVAPRAGYFYRAHSPMIDIVPEQTDWDRIFADYQPRAIFSDGICLGIDRFKKLDTGTAALLRNGFATAAKQDVLTCFDTNFRTSLWGDRGGLAGAASAYQELLPHVSVLTGSIGHFRALLQREDSDPAIFAKECLDDSSIPEELLKAVCKKYSRLTAAAASLREEISPKVHRWQCVALLDGTFYLSKQYEMKLVDRPGIGDAMALQIISGRLLSGISAQESVERAAAHGWLMSQVSCDCSPFFLDDIDAVWKNNRMVTTR